MADQPKMTLYQFDACPYCATARRRLGELGLQFDTITVPARPREARTQVMEVSGQLLVPVLVCEENGQRQIFSDENDILAYLDERFGAREPQPAESLPADAKDRLREIGATSAQASETLLRWSEGVRAAGETDMANCLRVAAINLREASGWAGRWGEDRG